MNHDADGFTQAAFSSFPGCHAHRFPNFRRDCRAVAEHLPYAKRPWFRVEEMVDTDVEANPKRML
jgi:hypothetical protein